VKVGVFFRFAAILATVVALSGESIAVNQTEQNEITSILGEVVVTGGSLKADSRARKQIEVLAKRLMKLPQQHMVEIAGIYPGESDEEHFRKSFFLAMEAEGYIRETLGVNKDYYLSARRRTGVTVNTPLIRIVLHSGKFEKQVIGTATTPPQNGAAPGASTGESIPTRLQVTPGVSFENINQQTGIFQQSSAEEDNGPIDERLVAEQARRATSLIEETKAKAAERDRRRKEEEKAASKDVIPDEAAEK
jgi:hypothetical protein